MGIAKKPADIFTYAPSTYILKVQSFCSVFFVIGQKNVFSYNSAPPAKLPTFSWKTNQKNDLRKIGMTAAVVQWDNQISQNNNFCNVAVSNVLYVSKMLLLCYRSEQNINFLLKVQPVLVFKRYINV